MLKPLFVIYRRCNFVYHYRVCTSIYQPLSYPFRSLRDIHSWRIIFKCTILLILVMRCEVERINIVGESGHGELTQGEYMKEWVHPKEGWRAEWWGRGGEDFGTFWPQWWVNETLGRERDNSMCQVLPQSWVLFCPYTCVHSTHYTLCVHIFSAHVNIFYTIVKCIKHYFF